MELDILMFESTITDRGRTKLPKPVREALGLKAGDRIRYIVYEGAVRILPVRPINRLFGALKYDGAPVTLEQMDKSIADAATEE